MRHSLRTFQASLLALVLGLVPASGAIMQTFIFNSGFQNGGSIPDGDPTGVVDARVITSSITNIDEISVSLDIGGTWAGDIYATLQHDSGFSVLLNRVGRSGTSSFGSSDDGFDVTLNDSGGHPDVHLQSSGGGRCPGPFGSDARAIDPNNVFDTDARTALLTSFNNLDANGGWNLFIADVSQGGAHTLNSWSLEITGTEGGAQVPEGGETALMLALALAGIVTLRLFSSGTPMPPNG